LISVSEVTWQGAYAADGRGACVTIEEAERWERLATAAQADLS
jgi:hypothetical protein